MTQLMQTLLQISITMAAVIGFMLLLVPVWQNRYSAKWRKLIWLVIAVRLLVPFSIELPEAPVQMSVNFQEAVTVGEQALYVEQTPTVPIVQTQPLVPTNPVMSSAPAVDAADKAAVPLDRGMALSLIWLAGALLFLGCHVVQYRRFKDKAMGALQPIEDNRALLHRASAGLEIERYPAVQFNHYVQSPMLIGLFKPMILIPQRIYDEHELLMILRHELIHYKHHDLWYKLILLCANAVHWFNPLVWLMNRQAGRDVEEVCDEYVVAGQDMAYRKAYTMTILNTMANQKGVALSTHLSKNAQNTKKRFSEILHPKQYKKGVAVLLLVVVAVAGASGCLLIRDEDKGQELYRRVAAYLPEEAIANPDVYEVTELENGRITYTWSEDPREETEGRVDKISIGFHDPDTGKNYRYERMLMIQTAAENDDIISVTYYRNENEMTPPVKPADIGRDAALRDEYVHTLLSDLVVDGDQYTFKDKETIYDTWAMQADSEQRAYYISDNAVNGNYYAIVLNLTYGYVERMYPLQHGEVFSTYVMEGVDERVLSQQLQRYGYYVIDHDPERYGWTHSHNTDDDGFVDTIFPLTMGYNDMHTEPRIEIIYLPSATINNWMDYEETAPRTDLHSNEMASQWANTGVTTLLGNQDAYYYPINDGVTVRFPVDWQIWAANGGGMVTYAYVKEVKDGCMVVKVSYPDTSEYIEGHGTRLHNMAQTFTLDDEMLVLVKNEDKIDEGVALYNRVAQYLPPGAIEHPEIYEEERAALEENIAYYWKEDPRQVEEWLHINRGGVEYKGEDGEYYRYQRVLYLIVSKEDNSIVNLYYYRDESNMTPPLKQSILASNAEERNRCIRNMVRDLIADGEQFGFGSEDNIYNQWYNENNTGPRAQFVSDNAVNGKYCEINLNLDYGYVNGITLWNSGTDMPALSALYGVSSIDDEDGNASLRQKHKYGYYAIDQLAEVNYTRSPIQRDGFIERFGEIITQHKDVDVVEPELAIAYLPDSAVDNWVDEADLAPERESAALEQSTLWSMTDDTIQLGNEDLEWTVWTAHGDGMMNYAYVTALQEGCMVVTIAHQEEDTQGLGDDMLQMAKTLVLDSRLLAK